MKTFVWVGFSLYVLTWAAFMVAFAYIGDWPLFVAGELQIVWGVLWMPRGQLL